MPGYARTLRRLAQQLEDIEDLLKEHLSDELTEFEGEIDDLESDMDTLEEKVSDIRDKQDDEEEEDPDEAA